MLTTLATSAAALCLGLVVGEFRARVARQERGALALRVEREAQRVGIFAENLRDMRDRALLLGVENMRLQGDLRDVWAELEGEQEAHHEERGRADALAAMVPHVHVFRPAPADALVVPNFGRTA